MSADIWYHELLAKNIIMSKSDEYHPHYNIDTKESEYQESDEIITKPKCTLEFNKPLITSYKSFVSNLKGFTMTQLCEKISLEWKKILNSYSEWVDEKIDNTNIISDVYICDDEQFTRVIVNFSIPLNESNIFTNQEITKLQFVVPRPLDAKLNNIIEDVKLTNIIEDAKLNKIIESQANIEKPEQIEHKDEQIEEQKESVEKLKKRPSQKKRLTEPPKKKIHSDPVEVELVIEPEQILEVAKLTEPKPVESKQTTKKEPKPKKAPVKSTRTKTSISDLIEKYK